MAPVAAVARPRRPVALRSLAAAAVALGAGGAIALPGQAEPAPATPSLPAPATPSLPASAQRPAFLERGLPGPAHDALQPLEGVWAVTMTAYVAGGTPDAPLVAHGLVAHKRLVAGGRFLEDITEGQTAAAPGQTGHWYHRRGWLGYSTQDQRFEWVTIDALSPAMMNYQSEEGEGLGDDEIALLGRFTDHGLLGEETAGRPVLMRTVLTLQGPDRHVLRLYVTPPGAEERLATEHVFTRLP